MRGGLADIANPMNQRDVGVPSARWINKGSSTGDDIGDKEAPLTLSGMETKCKAVNPRGIT